MRKIHLTEDKITLDDLKELSEWLVTEPRLTKGKLTEELERVFAEYNGTKYSVMVNSGSSALLLMLCAAIMAGKVPFNAKILIPNLSWSTDVSSAMFAGMNIEFIDVDLETLSVDLDKLEARFKQGGVDALLLISVLALVPDMKRIVDLCEKYGVTLFEDACESMGSEFEGQRLGSFGLASTYSTYFAHHISTIEGGFICTSDSKLYNVMKSMRSHGWDRDLDPEFGEELRGKYDVDEFKARFSFFYPSFNLRSTDLQAFIGLQQMKKTPEINRIRNDNFKHFLKCMPDELWKPLDRPGCFTSSFSYPMIVPDRLKLSKAFDEAGIECRPLVCGNMESQPFVIEHFPPSKGAPNAEMIDKHGLFVPNHTEVTFDDIEYICKIVKENT